MRAENPGDAEKTWGEFVREDTAETETFIPDIGSRADWRFLNEGPSTTMEADIKNDINAFLAKYILS